MNFGVYVRIATYYAPAWTWTYSNKIKKSSADLIDEYITKRKQQHYLLKKKKLNKIRYCRRTAFLLHDI